MIFCRKKFLSRVHSHIKVKLPLSECRVSCGAVCPERTLGLLPHFRAHCALDGEAGRQSHYFFAGEEAGTYSSLGGAGTRDIQLHSDTTEWGQGHLAWNPILSVPRS